MWIIFASASPNYPIQFSSVQFSRSVVSDSLQLHGLQHTKPPCPSPTPRVYSSSLSWWCHPTISSSVIPFSACLQSFPASGSFPMNQLFASGGHSIGVSASASILPMHIQDWFPLRLTGWISLLSKELSRVFSSTTVWRWTVLSRHFPAPGSFRMSQFFGIRWPKYWSFSFFLIIICSLFIDEENQPQRSWIIWQRSWRQ